MCIFGFYRPASSCFREPNHGTEDIPKTLTFLLCRHAFLFCAFSLAPRLTGDLFRPDARAATSARGKEFDIGSAVAAIGDKWQAHV